jgi:hypothetical protein
VLNAVKKSYLRIRYLKSVAKSDQPSDDI